MNQLVEFLRARFGEREANAWAIHDVTKCDALLYEEDMAAFAARTPECDCGEPARVLADVEAKRRIVKFAEIAREARNVNPAETMFMDFVLKNLALPYADHPGYREEWRV